MDRAKEAMAERSKSMDRLKSGGRAADSAGSGSGSWRRFLNLSSASNEGGQPEEGEVNQPIIQPQPPGHQPTFDQPGAPEAMPQAPAPAEDTADLIKTSIIQRMGELYPTDPWDPENSLIREKLFPGGKGKTRRRPMRVDELNNIHDRIISQGKRAPWAQELHRRIQKWDWENPRGPS